MGLSVIEGVHLVEAFLARHGPPRQLVVAQRTLAAIEAQPDGELARIVRAAGVEAIVLADRLFAQISQVEHGAGPIAVVATPRPPLPDRLDDDAVYLDRVQDPGNVGSVLRTCAAVGVRRVIASPGTAFCWSPKVLRAGMGAHFHLDIHEGVAPDALLERLAVVAMATTAGAPLVLYDADLRAPRVWLLGNEGQGLAPELLAAPGLARIAIPQTPAVESLNVGVAAAVCLYEQLRQRRLGPPKTAEG
jgi:TrmH family RNA methyltransferase